MNCFVRTDVRCRKYELAEHAVSLFEALKPTEFAHCLFTVDPLAVEVKYNSVDLLLALIVEAFHFDLEYVVSLDANEVPGLDEFVGELHGVVQLVVLLEALLLVIVGCLHLQECLGAALVDHSDPE